MESEKMAKDTSRTERLWVVPRRVDLGRDGVPPAPLALAALLLGLAGARPSRRCSTPVSR